MISRRAINFDIADEEDYVEEIRDESLKTGEQAPAYQRVYPNGSIESNDFEQRSEKSASMSEKSVEYEGEKAMDGKDKSKGSRPEEEEEPAREMKKARDMDSLHDETPRAAAHLTQHEGVHASLETGWGGDESVTSTRRIHSMVEARDYNRRVKLQIQKERAEEALHVTAVKIQSMWRMFSCYKSLLLAKVRKRREEKRARACTMIQKVFRGHQARNNVGLGVIIEFRKKQNSAAALVQSVFRGHVARMYADVLRQRRDSDLDLARSKRAQALIRGARTRSRVWMVWNFLRHKVSTIERFCKQRFQPWQREQVELLNDNLNKVVRIQALARRYLAYKRAREMRSAKRHFLAVGQGMVLFLVMMTLLLSFTINERSNGAFSDFSSALVRSFTGSSPQQLSLPLAAVRNPAGLWRWLNRTLLVCSFLERTRSCDVQVRNERNCTSSLSFEHAIPAIIVSSVAAGQKRSKRYRHGTWPLSGNTTAMVSSSPYSASNSDKSKYGSVYLPFQFDPAASFGALQGFLSQYHSGFFQLDDPLLGNSSFLDCGVPLVGGICRYQTGRWLDSSTRALVLGFAVASPSMNALMTVRLLVEMDVGGGIMPSLHTSSSRLQVYGGSPKPWDGAWDVGVRIFPEILFLLFGACYVVSILLRSCFFISFRPGSFFSIDKLEIRRPRDSLRILSLQPLKSLDNFLTFLLFLATFLWLLLQLAAQVMSSQIVAGTRSWSTSTVVGVADFAFAQGLVNLHGWGDAMIAIVAMLMWHRLLFSYISTIRRFRTSILSVRRLVVPLAALLITGGAMTLGLAHVAHLSFGRNIKGFETIDSCLLRLVQTLVAVMEEDEPGRMPAAVGGYGRTSSLAQGQSGVFMAVVFLLALCFLGVTCAVVIVAYTEEEEMTTGILNRPWLYEGTIRTAIYSDWELPPLSEVRHAVVEAFRSRVEEQVQLKKAAIQARVLSHIRADSLRVADVNSFKWALEVDKTKDLDRKTAKVGGHLHLLSADDYQWQYLMKTSRVLAHQTRDYDRRINQMESLFLLTSFRLHELIEHFVKLDFPRRRFHWPQARLSSDEIDKAKRLLQRQTEEKGKKMIKIPSKMLGAIEKQCDTLKKVMHEINGMVKDTNSEETETPRSDAVG
ncbi:hypothetical protein GUITHDRAFT_99993 [Guillardia theta CCMP2712]|uniref:Polycystin domain-containing protein n=1 Tax=Guillardia theta (strain CCMP2712) TaxID=905079 RepID=L1K0Z6_GUITC|nr:hypothetical protein GUITHDRAFT_99993 [Guillardia theta CCMP2712]EKX54516.1 hypothetical protein GUITHDRAFT_99993 [Guillardia theta CCMP2712]|eukprot:XP_005841496.1 hypothetical protein GUITHDRAFT_99993 [Guillardia theta CCMP2712]